MKKNILFFGPYPPPITGQSFSFKMVFDHFENHKLLCNTTKFNDNKLLNTLYSICKITYLFLFFKFGYIYFTCTRSNFGFLKDFYLILLARIFNKKVINHLHGSDFIEFYQSSKILKPFINFSYSTIFRSIVLTPSMGTQFSDFPKMEIDIVPNAYPIDFENSNCNFLFNERNQLVYFSNIMESKGILVFLKSLDVILTRFPNLTVKIAGAFMGDYLSDTVTIESKFYFLFKPLKTKYPNNLFYLGKVEGSSKISLLCESSIFVLPTFYPTEAFPITIIEAMRLGNAIVTTNHNYLPEIISSNNGFLVSKNSSEDIIDKVSLLLSDQIYLNKVKSYNFNEAKLKYSPNIFFQKIKNAILN